MTTVGPRPEWYPDPTGRHQHRYFDGARWTAHVADGGVTALDPIDAPPPVRTEWSHGAATRASAPPVDQGPALVVVFVALGAVVIGAFLPWVRASAGIFSVTRAGIDGDGVLTLVLAAIGGVLFAALRAQRQAAIAPLVTGTIALAIGAYDLADVTSKAHDLARTSFVSASAGAGLYLTVVGAAVAVVASIVALRRASRPARL